jgi:hypothetical protein
LLKLNAKLVGIGIGIGPVTFYHAIEDFYPELFPDVYLPNEFTFKIETEKDIIEKKIKIHDPSFHTTRVDKNATIEKWFTNHFLSKKILHFSKLGKGEMWWMDLNILFNEILELRKNNISIYNAPTLN